ncbi:hypothetical protein G5714_020907 [Onychostoma macrolepis]|uniref:Uncharacterized protein n=1 Tax=Onychostoma macrolepis TaxID=369639 RepID=A0A7J6BV59_9TELE|nr:hypothetical protein G5714_020907 [Onychostoma macrolepis]
MPNKPRFNHQKNKKMKNKQEESQTKGSRDTNTVKPERCNSMDRLSPTLSRDQAEEAHSNESEKLQDEKRPRP